MRLHVARMDECTPRFSPATALARTILALSVVVFAVVAASAQNTQPDNVRSQAPREKAKGKTDPASSKPKLGLLVNDAKAHQGYTLLAPTNSTQTYLIDMQGRVVRTWKSDFNPGLGAYFLENGNLLRTGQIRNPPFFGGGTGGRIQEFNWDGQLVWDFTYYNDSQLPNHDICKLPNGNVLMIVWEKKARKDAIAAGRRPETVGRDYMLAGSIFEVQPTGKTSGKIVWKWHSWDHLIQDFDRQKANYGNVAAHPELLDINFGSSTIAAIVAKPEEREKLRSIGYVGDGRRPPFVQPDWLHINAVAYNAELDQIMLSVYEFNEMWIIDHSTQTAEAAGHKGGRYGKGGDLLYRWGNPRAYRAGTVKDQKLFGQHNAQWIGKRLPGEGHVLIFNNGMQRPDGAYSSVDEFVLPVESQGHYERAAGKSFGPDKPVWSYAAPQKRDFYAPFISGAQRLRNGNTLICSGTNGTVFEVTPTAEIVWKYVNPDRGAPPSGGPPPGGGPSLRLGQILPSFMQNSLNFTAEQKKQLTAVEKQIAEKLGELLTEEQKKQFQQRPRGFADFPAAGQLISAAVERRLKLTKDQKKQLSEVQKEADGKLAAILKDAQKKQLKSMQDKARAFQTGGPPAGVPAGFGPPGGGGIFRAPRYEPSYAGLVGKDLRPGKTVEEIVEMNRPKQ